MRAYLVEDLNQGDVKRIESFLWGKNLAGPIEGVYFLPLPEEFLSPGQREHLPECGPFITVLEVLPEGALKLELLVRSRGKLRCSCIAYATPRQREYAIDSLDALIRELDVTV